MARVEQIPRQWRILRRLEAHRFGLSANDLAEEENCPVRTIYRDLDDLEEAGFPLIQERRGKRSLWKLAFNRNDPTIPFVYTEVCALWLSRRFAMFSQNTAMFDAANSAFEKVRAMLTPGVLEHLEEFESKVVVRNREQIGGEFEDIINSALENNERIEIVYYSPGKRSTTTRVIDPCRLWIQDQVRYLIAHCHLRDALRTFHLARIQKVTQMDEFFDETPELNEKVDAYLGQTFRVMGGEIQEYEVLFDADVKHVAQETIWHATQELIDQEDGSVLLRFKTGGMQEIKSWILGFGARVEVLKPVELREAIIADLQRAQDRYTTSE